MLTKEGLLGFFPKLTPKRFQDLIKHFGSIDAAWDLPAQALAQAGWQPHIIEAYRQWRAELDIPSIEKTLAEEVMHIISFSDREYPALLKEIADPPPCLFVRGNGRITGPTLAVVGTRLPTQYGIDAIHAFIPELVRYGMTTISGLALGIDAYAHTATIAASGTTVAVLGSGCDIASIAPQTNIPLAEKMIKENGLIISEYPPYTKATTYTFPRRNRIIAGLSLGTLVVEAGESSGALITAACSLDYNRDVFAIPQPITSTHGKGVNNLLKAGAIPVTSVQDILTALNIGHLNKKEVQTPVPPIPALSPIESEIYAHLSHHPVIIDELVMKTQKSNSLISSTLSLLEIKGVVKHLGGNQFIKKSM